MRAFFSRFFLTTFFALAILFGGGLTQSAYASYCTDDCDATTSTADDYDACVTACEDAIENFELGSSADAIEFEDEEESHAVIIFEDEVISADDDSSSSSSSGSTSSQYTDISNQGIIFAGICDDPAPTDNTADTCVCRGSGDCSLEDVLQVFVNIAYFILGISGSVLLFVFIYGGFKWLFSRGNPKWIEAGKEAITGGVIGLVIIFGSYVAINFLIAGLTGQEDSGGNLEDTIKNGTGIDASGTIQTE